MSVLKSVFLAIASAAVLYFAPELAPTIGSWFGASGFLATAIGSIVLAAGMTALTAVLRGGRGRGSDMDAGKVNVRVAEPPRWLANGTVRQGGGVLFAEFDAAGDLWYLVVHADSILVNANKYYLDDMPVTLDASGFVTTNEFCLTSKFEPYEGSGTRVPYIQIWTTTFSESDPTPPVIAALAAAFPTKWTADHKLVGTTYSVVRMKALKIEDRYKIYRWRGPLGLGEPAVSIAGDWSHSYDPRDVSQLVNDATTHEFTRNPALIWAWFRTHRYGRNKSRASINWDKVAEQATICDQSVVGIEGTQKRYECNISIPENKERSIAEQEILLSMDAQLMFDDDGKCWPRAGYYEAPTITLTRNRDIIAMESVEATNGESETHGVIVRYVSPEANYTVQPSAPWYNPLYYDEAVKPEFLTVDILPCQNHNQAMRLAKAIGMRSQPPHKLAPTTGLRALKARQERLINLNYDNTFAGDYEIATPIEIDPTGMFCGIGLVPVDADRWSLLSGEEKPKPVISEGEAVPAPALATGVTLAYQNARIEASFDAPARDDVTFEFEYVLTADIATDVWSDMTVQMNDRIAFTGGVIEGQSYSVRHRARTGSGRASGWSTTLTITPGLTIAAATMLQVTPGTGTATISWRNPTSPAFAYTDVRRGTTNVFAASTVIDNDVPGGLGQVQQVNHSLPAGTYYWWVVSYATDGTAATPTGPVSATVA